MRNPAAFTAVLFVDFVPGADVTAAGRRARATLAENLEVSEQAVEEFDALRPAESVEVDSAKATALGLAVVLVLAATLALLFTLNASVRRRRVELALLAAPSASAAVISDDPSGGRRPASSVSPCCSGSHSASWPAGARGTRSPTRSA